MKIDLDKIKKLPPDIKQEFMKMYLKHNEKKKVENINTDFYPLSNMCGPSSLKDTTIKKLQINSTCRR